MNQKQTKIEAWAVIDKEDGTIMDVNLDDGSVCEAIYSVRKQIGNLDKDEKVVPCIITLLKPK